MGNNFYTSVCFVNKDVLRAPEYTKEGVLEFKNNK